MCNHEIHGICVRGAQCMKVGTWQNEKSSEQQFNRGTKRLFSVKYLFWEAKIALNFLWLEEGWKFLDDHSIDGPAIFEACLDFSKVQFLDVFKTRNGEINFLNSKNKWLPAFFCRVQLLTLCPLWTGKTLLSMQNLTFCSWLSAVTSSFSFQGTLLFPGASRYWGLEFWPSLGQKISSIHALFRTTPSIFEFFLKNSSYVSGLSVCICGFAAL